MMIEDTVTEFKTCFTKDLVKTVVAFANTRGGKIYIGMGEDGTVTGLDDPDRVARQCAQSIKDNVRPEVLMNTSVDIIEMCGKNIVMITVIEGSSKPYHLKEKGARAEGVYIRKGPMSTPASDSAIGKMLRDWNTTPFDLAESIRQDLTFEYSAKYLHGCGTDLEDNNMRSLGLIRNGRFTNLAYLLSDQCDCAVKIAAFADDSRDEMIKRGVFKGPLFKQLEESLLFIKRFNFVGTIITGSARRTDVPSYPEAAVRESMINAIVHRDYSISGDTLVSIFPDSIEFTSLGGLNRDIDIDDLYAGISSPRNKALADLFFSAELIEAHGTGIPRIMSKYRDHLRRPSICVTTNTFKIILPSVSTTSDEVNGIIMEMLGRNGTICRLDVETALGVSRAKANNILQEMTDSGLISRTGRGRSTRYAINR